MSAGKGDNPRPMFVSREEFERRFDKTFKPCNKCGEPQEDARGGTCRQECSSCRFPYPHGDCSD